MAFPIVVSDSPEWVTLAQVESPCEAVQLPGQFTDGDTVPCPLRDHEHVLAHTIALEVVPSLTIGTTIHLFPRR